MLSELKEKVYRANMELWEKGMVIYTWGNVSGIDSDKGLVVIKPSGVDYGSMQPEDMVVVDLNGNVVEGKLGGVVHTHSVNAVAFAQAGKPIPALGTTHADYFFGDIPCTRSLTAEEVQEAYEINTGNVIVETFEGKDPMAIPGVVVKNHGPFSWGKSPEDAVYNSVVMEKVAEMARITYTINPNTPPAPQYMLDKHYYRKHGPNAYYGQSGEH